ncbi:MAG TPA: HlyC/CorC family transporter [Nitrospiraceae bacterium]|nr:HlyC/CorC family transporter [Nitrospiraceae bacterium]HBI24833.1 HlyC/CorC family transporter [Nitrospiraceae bacterium]
MKARMGLGNPIYLVSGLQYFHIYGIIYIMKGFWLELILILIFILANGFFAGAEIAIISARKSRIKHLMERGSKQAEVVHKLQNEPENFIATVQIGITIVGMLAGAIGGAAAIEVIKPLLQDAPFEFIQNWSTPIAIAIVVLITSYLSIILGELVPKSLALRFSEPIALFVGKPIHLLSRFSFILVKLLTKSSSLFLKPFGKMPPPEGSFVTEEEIKILLREGGEKGIFEKSEQELIHSVFEFVTTTVKEIMVPRPKIKAIAIDTSIEAAVDFVVECGFSRFPVYDGSMDDIKGILYEKDLLDIRVKKKDVGLKDLIRPVYFVPETKKIDKLLRELQRRRMHMAIVINEYGGVEGMVTMEDIIEEIVGEIEDEYDYEDRPVKILKDGSMVIDASLPIRDLIDQHNLAIEESEEYETLAGLVLSLLQKMPRGGEIVKYGDYKLTIVDIEGKRISKVKLEKVVTTADVIETRIHNIK